MKKIIIGLLVTTVLFFVSCDSEDNKLTNQVNINFDLSDAQAVLLQEAASPKRRTANNENTNLFKIDSDGNISPLIDNVTVTFVRTFSQGLYVEISDEQTFNLRRFYVRLDNSHFEIEEEIGIYKGENEDGDLIFSDLSILRANTVTVDKLQTTLDAPTVQSISGNLAVITGNSVFQVFNTVTNLRYNVQGCNGPRMEAFSGSLKAIIDDCSNQILLDMSNGNRTETGISGWNHESLRVSDGIIILSQGIANEGNLNNYALGHINQDGNFTVLTGNIFQPGSSSCINCGAPNTVLYGVGQLLIIKGLNKISVVDRSNGNSVRSILDGFNVTKISTTDNTIYFLAEDNLGNPITGTYSLLNNENQVIDNQTMFNDIQTF